MADTLNSLFDLTGKVALVTGGRAGLGRMIAMGLLAQGARVYIASRGAEGLQATAGELSQYGECIAIPCDLSNMEGIDALFADVSAKEDHLDILVNNAGLATMSSLDEFTEEMWDGVMDINAKGVFFTCQRMLPLLRAAATPQSPARIINIASAAGLNPPAFNAFSYAASKAACIMLTRHLARDLAEQHILVNAIAPGPFDTDMMADRLAKAGDIIRDRNPLKRLGTMEDIVGCAQFLAGRGSAWTTGAVIPCDGGASTVR
ncbi:SDR family oxidoreductase [Novosphingobium album (ex Hu et al. 2023)]|uniref:SDR family oxidoreductase n=1 Tax=Novosphingobium album (ex Hu et al. 2023) TaxID=2930093 RepID=A0ABT0B6P8_9SPHN|nr:SDR family oxidoreductase [Novosphingobium album (ex Hu et al. 2023)]MCJ2180747.1 SDR family oxidoreductase [Novosphingobium album (ex Hu et al. 2023)]